MPESTPDWNNIWTSMQELGAAISPLTEQVRPPAWAVSLQFVLDIAIEEVEETCSALMPAAVPITFIPAVHPKDEAVEDAPSE